MRITRILGLDDIEGALAVFPLRGVSTRIIDPSLLGDVFLSHGEGGHTLQMPFPIQFPEKNHVPRLT